jgi:hypothetical protein
MRYGEICRRCKPGEERHRGRCISTFEAGAATDEDEATDEMSASDAGTNTEPDAQESFDSTTHADEQSVEAGATPDAGPTKPIERCYRDQDGDGIGAGDAIDCALEPEDAALSPSNMDCNDFDPNRSPSLTDICGDNIDNDCDGTPDDESNNACDGPCSVQLGRQPGEACNNGLTGACHRSGIYQCTGPASTACTAPAVTGTTETCGDSIDNDCDGSIDEDDASDATQWYEDCDGDGYSAVTNDLVVSGIGTRRACLKPAPTTHCDGGWTNRRPQSGSTWDCDDSSSAYHPGAGFGVPPEGRTSVDLNCNGVEEKEDAVAVGSIPVGTFDPVPRCTASLSCESCGKDANGNERQAALWVDANWRPLDSQPPCSRSINDRFGSFQALSYLGFCPGGQWGAQGPALQRCR